MLLLIVVGSLSACSKACIHSYLPWSNEDEHLLKEPKEKWVTLYRKLEDALLNSPELLDNLREKFFPSRGRYQAKIPASIDGIQVHYIPMCVTFSNRTLELLDHLLDGGINNHNVNSSISKCINFRWTNSRLLNIIPADQLSAMDPLWTKMLYSAIVSARSYSEYIVISLELDMDDINTYDKTLSEEDFVTSMTILLSWVSNRHELE